jgi:hypothetical protein
MLFSSDTLGAVRCIGGFMPDAILRLMGRSAQPAGDRAMAKE